VGIRLRSLVRVAEVVMNLSLITWMALSITASISARAAAYDPVDQTITQRLVLVEQAVKQVDRDADKHSVEFQDLRKAYELHAGQTSTRLTVIETTLTTNSQVLYAVAISIIIALLTRLGSMIMGGLASRK
jgi:hypothetical protein